MAEQAKVKEPTLREKVVSEVFGIVLEGLDLAEAPLTKEGMLLDFEDSQFVVKVIQKKARVEQADIKGIFEVPGESEEEAEEEDEFEMEEEVV